MKKEIQIKIFEKIKYHTNIDFSQFVVESKKRDFIFLDISNFKRDYMRRLEQSAVYTGLFKVEHNGISQIALRISK